MTDLKNGTILNGGNPLLKRQFTPRDIDDLQLARLNHAEWLEEFSQILGLTTGVKMTPKREGTITRLHWASKYVKLLEKTVKRLEEERRAAVKDEVVNP